MTFPRLNSYVNFVLKKTDDHHCFMLSLHGDELRCGVYLSTKSSDHSQLYLSRMTMKNDCSRFEVF